MKLNGYQLVCESIDNTSIEQPVVEIIQDRLGKKIDNLDASLVNDYGATSEDIADIIMQIEEKLHVYMSQETQEKEVVTARSLIDAAMINLKDPSSKNRIVKQVASHIEGTY
jgi:acyl carrier protein